VGIIEFLTIGINKMILTIMICSLAILLCFLSIKIVPQGNEWTIENLGKYTRTLKPGLNFIIPLIEMVGKKVIIMEQVIEVPSQSVITKDNAEIRTDGVVFFQITSPEQASYQIQNLDIAIKTLVLTNIRTVIGSMNLDDLLSQRDSINNKLLMVIDNATMPWGIKVTRIEIKDISPPSNLINSMALQMTAEREKRASILVAEGEQQAAILKAEGEKQAAILLSESKLQAAINEAEGQKKLAEAQAYTTTIISEAIASGDINSIHYSIAEKYIESLSKIGSSDNSKLVFMPLEASSIIGSLGGIKELFIR